MNSITKKKPKEIEKEIKLKLVQVIEGILIKSDTSSLKKLKKTIKSAASEIAKKYTKAVKKNEKKIGKSIKPVAKKAKVPTKRTKLVKSKKSGISTNGKTTLPAIKE